MASSASARFPPAGRADPRRHPGELRRAPQLRAGDHARRGPQRLRDAPVSSLSPALLGQLRRRRALAHGVERCPGGHALDWVSAGGNLIALRPDTRLAGAARDRARGRHRDDAYLSVDTPGRPGAGSRARCSTTARPTATRCRRHVGGRAQLPATPAVTLRTVGAGHAAAFTYDLSRSIVGPARATPPGRARSATATRQAGPRRRRSSARRERPAVARPLPRDGPIRRRTAAPARQPHHRDGADADPAFLVPPNGYKAAVVLTGDDHGRGGTGGTAQRFQENLAASAPGCSLIDWQCVRSTSYIYPDVAQAGLGAAAAQNYETRASRSRCISRSTDPMTAARSPRAGRAI